MAWPPLSTDPTINTLMDTFRSTLTGATDDAISLELFGVVDEICREALRASPPTNPDGDPALWGLTAAQLLANYQTLMHGTLARLYGKASRPYANAELAKYHLAKYQTYLGLSRDDAAGSPTTAFQRLTYTVRALVPHVRDSTINLSVYTIADKIRREVLNLRPLDAEEDTDPTEFLDDEEDTDPTECLPDHMWDRCYQVMLRGVLADIYAQPGREWSSPDAAKAQYDLFEREFELVRTAIQGKPKHKDGSFTRVTRLINNVRLHLPSAFDDVVKLELFNVADEFFKFSNLWVEKPTISTVANNNLYYVEPCDFGIINQLLFVFDQNGFPVDASMARPGEITLAITPTSVRTLNVIVALTVADPTDTNGLPLLPDWVMDKYANDLFEGIVGRMMSTPAKPYTSDKMAIYHLRRFRQAMAKAKIEAQRQNTYRRQAWAFPQQFSTFGQKYVGNENSFVGSGF